MKRDEILMFRPAALLLAGLFFVLGAGPAPRLPPIGRAGAAPQAEPAPVKIAERPIVSLKAEVRPGLDGLPSQILGTMTIKGWNAVAAARCLYVPYADIDYGRDRAITRRQELFTDKHGRQLFEGGSTVLRAQGASLLGKGAVLRLSPAAYPIGDATDAEVRLTFESHVPRLPGTGQDEWFFDGFAPRLLQTCPGDDVIAVRDLPAVATDLTYSIKIPDGWAFVGPGALSAEGGSAEGSLTAAHIAFGLTRGQQRLAAEIAGVHVDFVYRTPAFLQIMATVESTLPLLKQLFGEYPYKSITIVESSELQRFGLPGLIAVNRAQQGLFDRLQSDWLNWMHWVVVSQLVKQWYGGAVVARSPDDEWLTAGIAEFAILDVLRRSPERFNLFTEWEPGVRILSLDFQQVSEITAALMRQKWPFAVVTGADLRSLDTQRQQTPLLFVKHAEAMRQMKGLAGDAAFYGFLRQVTSAYLHKALTPEEFYAFLARKPSPFPPTVRDELQKSLKAWWTQQGWPDFAMKAFDAEQLPDGRWLAQVTASQQGQVDFPPLIGIQDESGRTHFIRADPKKKVAPDGESVWHAAIAMPYKPIKAEVDPTHEAYDFDRFNNSSDPPTLQFFPGGAETLRDDAYTLLWLPYIYRLPAQPFSVGLQGAVFRYIVTGLYMKAEVAPKEKLGGFEVRRRIPFEDKGYLFDLNLSQNYDNDRLTEAAVTKTPLWSGDPLAEISLHARYKQRLGITDSRHMTFVVGASLKTTDALGVCSGLTSGEFEKTPPKFAKGFEYDRAFGIAAGDCALTPRTSLGTRLFYGDVRLTGTPPGQAYFKPTDLREARLRIDNTHLALARRLATVGTDLTLPFFLPLPSESLILARQLRWRLFYDYGKAFDEPHDYRSAGLGFLLPFGGDLSGAGSLSVTKLTMLGILYSSVDGTVSRKPSIVFDLSGDL